MSETSGPGIESSVQFHIAEYGSLHGEIRELLIEARTLERQVVFATGAVWSWLAVHGQSAHALAWFLPVLFSVGGAIRAAALKKEVNNIASYIWEIEYVLATTLPNLPGWHRFREQKALTAGLLRGARIFWSVLILITLVVPITILLL